MAESQARTAARAALSPYLKGEELKAALAIGAEDLSDLLRRRPRRYRDVVPLRDLQNLHEGEEITARVEVLAVTVRPMRARRGYILEAKVEDLTADLTLTFFLPHQGLVSFHEKRLTVGREIVVSGTVGFRTFRNRTVAQITHPDYQPVDGGDPEELAQLERPQPVYPLTGRIAQRTMRRMFRHALAHADRLEDPVPVSVLVARAHPDLTTALHDVHQAENASQFQTGRRRMAFEEMFVLQAIFAQRRAQDARLPAPALTADGPLRPLFDGRLPFTLTDGQQQVGAALDRLLSRGHPTSSLLQGDVGSGKTVVALRAMLRAVDSGHQAVLLAPTEVLAAQHHRTITALMGELGRAGRLDGAPEATRVRLLTGSMRTTERRETLLDVTSGGAGIIIGTHALLTDGIDFASLGLVVIDEQHRFGVDHRRRLRSKGAAGQSPHMIVMTATPIPRTAALATVGDLDVLSLTEMPDHRAGVTSYVVPEAMEVWENRMWSRASEEIAVGRQVFVVCPRIDEEDPLDGPDGPPPRGVLQTAERLGKRQELAGAGIGVLHGRMTPEQKRTVMEKLLTREIDILVATTVVEVGVDVPNASVMIVLDAEHFGVSQLHQLRGRVGRGEHPGLAFFDTRAAPDSDTTQHLSAVAGTTDGFALADLDLQRRGAGSLIGDEQSGLQSGLRFFDQIDDDDLVPAAREDAFAVVGDDPELRDHPVLADAIRRRLRDADPDVERS